jgi:hypothetical protein
MEEVIIQVSGDNGVLVTNGSVYVGPTSVGLFLALVLVVVLLLTKWSKTKDRLFRLVPQAFKAWKKG